jgi:hypothetical protein
MSPRRRGGLGSRRHLTIATASRNDECHSACKI